MGLLKFLMSIIKDTLSIRTGELKLQSKTFNPRKLFALTILIVMSVSCFMLTNKLIRTTHILRKERAEHAKYVQECESKNKTSKSSDSGNGLKPRPTWIYQAGSHNYSGCRGEECSFVNQSSLFGDSN